MEVDEAVLKAKGDQEPNLQELTTDVYVNNLEKYIRGPILYNLGHFNVGQSFVPLGTPKATAKSDIKETPKEDESNKDGKAEVKAKNGSDSKKLSAEKATEASKPPNKKINAPSKDNTSTENSPQPPPASSTRTDNNDKK